MTNLRRLFTTSVCTNTGQSGASSLWDTVLLRVGWNHLENCLNMGTNRTEFYVSLLRIKQQHGCWCETGPKKKQKKKRRSNSVYPNKQYNFTLRAATLCLLTLCGAQEMTDQEWNLISPLCSLFPPSPLLHTDRTHTSGSLQHTSRRVIWDWRKPCWKMWHLETIRTEKNN